MKKIKDYWILGLFIAGIAVFCWIQLMVLPERHQAEERYAQEQLSPLTQDFNYIAEYESDYLGDNSNTFNLFRSLPMTQDEMTFQLYPEELGVEIHYPTTLNESAHSTITTDRDNEYGQKEENIAYRALLYNTTAAFALIKNINQLTFEFQDSRFDFKRSDFESMYSNLDQLLDEDTWIQKVQQPLQDDQYVEKIFKELAIVH
ncbi:DUF4825 domain-containing protein [Marinilactibacillus sp. GCM10026970]|uniref:DUF4825 domain-containing protein n=1 Tax=Marinilactibacillus sp. GCM10026970 TaxID=3252642 RepID=UPI00360A773E